MQPHVSHHMQSAAVSVRGVPVQAWTSRRARRRRPAARAARGSARSAPRCQTSAGAARPRPSAAPPPRASAPAWWAAPRPTAPPALLRADPRSSPAGLQAIPPSQVFQQSAFPLCCGLCTCLHVAPPPHFEAAIWLAAPAAPRAGPYSPPAGLQPRCTWTLLCCSR